MVDVTPAVQVPFVWVGVEDAEIAYANQILVQMGEEGEFFITFAGDSSPSTLSAIG